MQEIIKIIHDIKLAQAFIQDGLDRGDTTAVKLGNIKLLEIIVNNPI